MSKEPPKPIDLENEAIEKNAMGRGAPVPETIVDENGRILVGREAEQYMVNATARIEKIQIGKDLELSRKGPLQNGRQNREAGLSAKIRDTQKEKDKKDKEFRRAISEAQKALEACLANLTTELKEIDEGLNAIAKLRALHKNDAFDKGNAEHIILMQKVGITSEEMESPEGGVILDEKEKDFHERRKEVIEKSQELIQEAEANGFTSETITEFKQKLEQTDSAVAYDAAINHEAPEELKSAAGTIFTQDEKDLGVLDNQNSFFGTGISVAKNNGIGEGITFSNAELKMAADFSKVADPKPSTDDLSVAVVLNLDRPKVT